jgi:hypothetical protein
VPIISSTISNSSIEDPKLQNDFSKDYIIEISKAIDSNVTDSLIKDGNSSDLLLSSHLTTLDIIHTDKLYSDQSNYSLTTNIVPIISSTISNSSIEDPKLQNVSRAIESNTKNLSLSSRTSISLI